LASSKESVKARKTLFPNSDEQEISALLSEYFELKYQIFHHLTMIDLSDYWIQTDTYQAEISKLQLELAHAQHYNLGIAEYEYYLEYEDWIIDPMLGTAQLKVIEGHDIVFQISKPIVSSQRNVYHRIDLERENGAWKIKLDDYDDYLWRWLRTTGQSPSELAQTLKVDLFNAPDISSDMDEIKAISYNRQGAVDYVHQWALATRPYNQRYYDFTDLGGDCTNFVSQAIFEGGEIGMVFGGVHDVGTVGWYYYDINDRAIAWTWVDGLYNFIVNEQSLWDYKLPGIKVGYQNALAGDLIQYNWGNDTVWDHSVLIVSPKEKATEDQIHLVAGHSPDVDNYPYTTMIYSPNYRFIHIHSEDAEDKIAQHNEPESAPTPEITPSKAECKRKIVPFPCPTSSLLLKRLCRVRVECGVE
jgi:hypothetical protein